MKHFFTALITVISLGQLFSQNQDVAYPHVIPMTPNAAELTKYQDSPVSYYTGTPNINIPLYEIDVDGFKIPLSLNYHASGIKVDQEATWVGLGWSLDVGGRISRTVKSADDFTLNGFDRNFPHILDGYYDAPDIDSNYYNHYGDYGNSSCNYSSYGCNDYDLLFDPEPDIFYYNLPGLSGKFILDKSRGAVLFDKSHNLKIELIRTSTSVKFKLTDKEGNEYYYNQWETTTNYTANGWLNKNIHTTNTIYDDATSDFGNWTSIREDESPSNTLPNTLTTSWCLSKIITNRGKEINFVYAAETQYLPTQESSEKYSYNGRDATYFQKSKVVNSGLRLSQISGDFGYIQFSSTDRLDIKGTSKKLTGISIYNMMDQLVKSFQFDYGYFNNSYSGNYLYEHVFKRLKLTKVTEYSSTNAPLNNGYNFNYYVGDFPPKNSKDVDYWGFQNGRTYGKDYIIGLQLANELYSGVKRDFNFSKAIIGTLQSIVYPTGGTEEFIFESNTISSNFLDANTYEWLPTSPSNNNLLSLDVFNYYNSIDYNLYSDLPSQMVTNFEIHEQTQVKVNSYLENTMQVRDLSYSYGSYSNPLGVLRRLNPSTNTYYTYLCPLLWDASSSQPQGTGSEANLTERQFSLEPGTYQFEAYKPPRDVLASWRLTFDRPLPSSSSTGDGGGTSSGSGPYAAGGIRIKEIITDATKRKFRYPAGTMLREPVLYYFGFREGLPFAFTSNCLVQVSESRSPLTTFNIGSFVGYDWVTEESDFDKDDNISKTKYTFYNVTESDQFDDQYPDSPYYLNYTNGLIKSIEKYKTENQDDVSLVEKDEYFYTSTYGNIIKAFRDKGPGEPMGVGPSPTQARSILGYYYQVEWPLQTKRIQTSFTDDNKSIIKETNSVFNYRDLLQSISTSINNDITTEKIKYPFNFTDAISNAMVTKNMVGIPIENLTLVNSKIKEATITNYNTFWGNYLPASIKRAELNSVNLSEGNQNSFYQPYLNFNNYDSKGNLLEVSKENGLHIYYVWGYFGQYPIAKIENFHSQTDLTSTIQSLITAAKNASEGDNDHCTDGASCNEKQLRVSLNALRNALPNAMVTTYTYNPLIGITSKTDPTGYITFYEYDSFNRLKQVKDANGYFLSHNLYNYR